MAWLLVLLIASLLLRCESRNDRPIIGILAQEVFGKDRKYGDSYIAASYVKYLESAGARVVPIKINESQQYYEDIFKSVNGVLFPGGGANIFSSGYSKAGRTMFDLAVQSNQAGDYFPLWGTCLGFELMNLLPYNKTQMEFCSVEDVALPLSYVSGYKTGRLFQNMSADIEHILATEPVTINYHRWCITAVDYSITGLDKFYKILSVGKHENITFISTIEAFKYPFYAVAWHPEKNPFEFVFQEGHRNIPHTPDAIRISQYFANFFVNEARKSQHRFLNETEEKKALIYNYQPVYTGLQGSTVEQQYFFGKKKAISVWK